MTFRWKTAIGSLAAAFMISAPVRGEEAASANGEGCVSCETDYGCEEEVAGPTCRCLQSAIIGDCLAERTGLYLYGWTEIGANWNDGGSTINFPAGAFAFEQGFNINQFYLVQGRSVDADKMFDAGYRVDLLYGLDARTTQAFGLEKNNDGVPLWIKPGNAVQRFDPYSGTLLGQDANQLAMPQLYVELSSAIGPGVNVKVGHFYTIIGYEVVTAPDNFFYTHAYTMNYGEPFTHTGVLASSSPTDWLTVQAGIVRGWDNWEDNNNSISGLWGFSINLGERVSLAYAAILGPEHSETGFVPVSEPRQQRYMQSLVAQIQLTDKLKNVWQSDYGVQDNVFDNGTSATWYGLMTYLFYDINDNLAVGTRLEWFDDNDGFRVVGVPGSYYETTFGLNWSPCDCIIIRPEIRWDWFKAKDGGSSKVYGANPDGTLGASDSIFIGACDIIFSY